MEKNLYILDWDNGMIGIFRGSDLSQVDNSTKESFFDSLHHLIKMYDCENVCVNFLESYDELKKLREQRGLEQKPLFDEWLKQEMCTYDKE